jgi:hypothetical protein
VMGEGAAHTFDETIEEDDAEERRAERTGLHK